MSKMISAVHHIAINGYNAEEIEARLKAQASKLKKIPGFLYYRLLRPLQPEDPYAILTFWQSRKHYLAAMHAVQFVFV